VSSLRSVACRHAECPRSRAGGRQSEYCNSFLVLPRYPPGMPVPERNHIQVVRCKGIGCGRNVPTPIEVRVRTGSITVVCRAPARELSQIMTLVNQKVERIEDEV
jgi:hypothetical protein